MVQQLVDPPDDAVDRGPLRSRHVRHSRSSRAILERQGVGFAVTGEVQRLRPQLVHRARQITNSPSSAMRSGFSSTPITVVHRRTVAPRRPRRLPPPTAAARAASGPGTHLDHRARHVGIAALDRKLESTCRHCDAGGGGFLVRSLCGFMIASARSRCCPKCPSSM